MKKIKQIFLLSSIGLVLVLGSCESYSTDTFATDAGQTGQSGSLARFTILDDYLYTVDDQDLNVFNMYFLIPRFEKLYKILVWEHCWTTG
ncbi:MAG: hypothetical protein HRT68_08450, partial [Flavobacteriaceae bacterium]|nr:hypothetical protein [Flavobacteriaceae bacterium]